jgi:polyisoprenoid-binding protein YceI
VYVYIFKRVTTSKEVIAVTVQAQPSTAVYKIDTAHSLIEFAVKHMMVATVKGRFSTFDGTIVVDEQDPARSSVEVTIDAASIDTREPQRDNHLRSPDFLDVEKFPHITFRSTQVERIDDQRLRIHGNLTIRDVTRPVALEATFEGKARDPWGNERLGFTASTRFDRRDFGLQWNVPLEAGGILVGNEVRVNIEVEAIRQQA